MSSETDNIVSPLANKRTAKSFNGSVKRAALSDISNAQTPTPKETVLPTTTTPSLIKKEKKVAKPITALPTTKSTLSTTGSINTSGTGTGANVASVTATATAALVQATSEIDELKRKLEDEKERVREYQKQVLEDEDRIQLKSEQMEALRQNIMYMACYNDYKNPSAEPETWTTKEISAHIAVVKHLMKRDTQLTKKLTSGTSESTTEKLICLKELEAIKNTIQFYGGLSSDRLE